MEGELSMWTIIPLWIKLLFGLVFATMLLFLVGKATSPLRSVFSAKRCVATEASGTLFLATDPLCNMCSIEVVLQILAGGEVEKRVGRFKCVLVLVILALQALQPVKHMAAVRIASSRVHEFLSPD